MSARAAPLLMLCALAVSACAEITTPPAPVVEGRDAAQGGAYQRTSSGAPGGQREDRLLDTAAALIRAKDVDGAQRTLQGLPPSSLNPTQAARRQTLLARIALAQRKPQAALDSLRGTPAPNVSTELRAEIQQLRAEANTQLGTPPEAARAPAAGDTPAKQDPRPQHIALLLSFSGPYAEAGAALRDGFIAAYYGHGDKTYRPEITLYDVGGDPKNTPALYTQAVAAGAQFVVGPLEKEAVNALLASGSLSVPTLALNYVDQRDTLAAPLYQFGLSPEDEARQVAERAFADARTTALAVYPDGDWGARVYNAFKARWIELGGHIAESQTYNPEQSDYSVPLRRLLNLDESENRARKLKATLGVEVKAEPRRRQDADFIFMAASARPARQLRPQLSFYYAGDLPIYATSHIYGGSPSKSDNDVEGVIFCDSPWVLAGPDAPLAQEIKRLWPDMSEPARRLYAVGADAFGLVTALPRMALNSKEVYPGNTGALVLTEDKRIYRILGWARFTSGTPRALPAN